MPFKSIEEINELLSICSISTNVFSTVSRTNSQDGEKLVIFISEKLSTLQILQLLEGYHYAVS